MCVRVGHESQSANDLCIERTWPLTPHDAGHRRRGARGKTVRYRPTSITASNRTSVGRLAASLDSACAEVPLRNYTLTHACCRLSRAAPIVSGSYRQNAFNCDLLPFDVETDVRVASKVRNLPTKFGHARPWGSRIIRYVRDGRTDGRIKATLIVPSLRSEA